MSPDNSQRGRTTSLNLQRNRNRGSNYQEEEKAMPVQGHGVATSIISATVSLHKRYRPLQHSCEKATQKN